MTSTVLVSSIKFLVSQSERNAFIDKTTWNSSKHCWKHQQNQEWFLTWKTNFSSNTEYQSLVWKVSLKKILSAPYAFFHHTRICLLGWKFLRQDQISNYHMINICCRIYIFSSYYFSPVISRNRSVTGWPINEANREREREEGMILVRELEWRMVVFASEELLSENRQLISDTWQRVEWKQTCKIVQRRKRWKLKEPSNYCSFIETWVGATG